MDSQHYPTNTQNFPPQISQDNPFIPDTNNTLINRITDRIRSLKRLSKKSLGILAIVPIIGIAAASVLVTNKINTGKQNLGTKAASAPVDLQPAPSTINIQSRQVYTADINIDTKGQLVTAVDLKISNQNTNSIQIVDITPSANLPVVVFKDITDPAHPRIVFASVCDEKSCTPFSGNGPIATIHLTSSSSPTNSQLTFTGTEISLIGESTNQAGALTPLSFVVNTTPTP